MATLNTINSQISCRDKEMATLHSLLQTNESELVAVLGRRRVGKTFLIRKSFEKELIFSLTGIRDASKAEQLENFSGALTDAYGMKIGLKRPQSWTEAFNQLKDFISSHKQKAKKVIFLDELPWLASPRSGFLQAFDHFWNSWAVNQHVVVVICGSAATWMITEVINSKGGLHNRITKKLHLEPFTLIQTEKYFKEKGITLPRLDIITIYMAIGGIPFYLREIQRGDTASMAIDRLCFGKGASLLGEFENLYRALFTNYKYHIEVIRALATKWKGLTRNEILQKTSISTGGGFSLILRELEESSFIASYKPFGKKERETLYRLTDEYSLFYLTFIENAKSGQGSWMKKAGTPQVKTWCGYAFESICFKHIGAIKEALGIAGIYTEESSFIKQKDDETPGFQIDMLIDRADNAINICEAKFYHSEYVLTAVEAEKMRKKRAYFQASTGTSRQLINTLITTYGLISNQHSSTVEKVLTMDSLFL